MVKEGSEETAMAYMIVFYIEKWAGGPCLVAEAVYQPRTNLPLRRICRPDLPVRKQSGKLDADIHHRASLFLPFHRKAVMEVCLRRSLSIASLSLSFLTHCQPWSSNF